MAFEYGSQAIEIRNPFRLEGFVYTVRGAVVTAHAAEHYAPLVAALRAVREEADALGLPLSAVAAMLTSEETS